MSAFSIAALFAIMVTLAAIPSASVALVVARSATRGIPDGMAVSMGIVCGDLVFVVMAILGMSYLAESLGSLFAIFKYLGGAYLIYLGWGLILSKQQESGRAKVSGRSSIVMSFSSGFFLTLGDVKAILFYASLFPLLVDLSDTTASTIGTVLVVTFVSVGGVKLFYAIMARRIVQKFQYSKSSHWLQKGSGGILIGAGSCLILKA